MVCNSKNCQNQAKQKQVLSNSKTHKDIRYYKKCESCLAKLAEEKRQKRIELKKSGICIVCMSKAALKYSVKCEQCWFRHIANITCGNVDIWQDIQELFYAQNGESVLSGKTLILGKNASLDHIIPQCESPQLSDNIKNLRWITKIENSQLGGIVGSKRQKSINAVNQNKELK